MPKKRRITAAEQRLRRENNQLKAENFRLKELSVRDSLTGLLNRRGFQERAESFVREAKKTMKDGFQERRASNLLVRNFALIVFDIDVFDALNAEYGHLGGDAVLKAFTDILAERRGRSVDLAARWGGDEFVLGLPGSGIKDALRIAEEIRAKAEATRVSISSLRRTKNTATFTVSAGVADMGYAPTLRGLIEVADEALMAAKNSNRRNRVAACDEKFQAGPRLLRESAGK